MLRCSATRAMTRTLHEPWPRPKRPPRQPGIRRVNPPRPQKIAESISRKPYQTFIPEGNDLAERLATDPRVAFLSFIGSARVGWSLHHKLAPGTRSALEHGGVAPAIVDRSADLDRIMEPLTKGGYYHAGQVCVSTQRIFVHADILARFVERFADRVRSLKVGDPTH